MNSPAAAFSGDYTDLRFIKTRSVAAITIEIPIEQASAFVAAFGAPVPASGCPVAIARINPSPVRQQLEASVALLDKPPKERRSWSDTPYVTQAAIRCGEPEFWEFLHNSWGNPRDGVDADSPEWAAKVVRTYCGVASRRDIDPKINAQAASKWLRLNDSYESWLRR